MNAPEQKIPDSSEDRDNSLDGWEKNEPEQQNTDSGTGERGSRRRGGWLRRGNPMGCDPWVTELNRYVGSEAFAGKTEGYRIQVRRYLTKCKAYLQRLNLDTNPNQLEARDIALLYACKLWVSLHERHMMMTRLRPFLAWCGNRAMYAIQLDLKPPTPRRKQYSIHELKSLREAAQGPYEQWALHLEQDYGVRRITVLRAHVDDFDRSNGIAILRVKGRGGTKTMEMPLHPDTIRFLDAAEQQREAVITSCREKGYSGPIPPEIMLVKWDGRPKPIGGTALDNMLIRICNRAEIPPKGHHANRRGVAAVIYEQTKDLVATQEFLGHADPKTTEMYIGTGLDRQRKAQSALARAFASECPIPAN